MHPGEAILYVASRRVSDEERRTITQDAMATSHVDVRKCFRDPQLERFVDGQLPPIDELGALEKRANQKRVHKDCLLLLYPLPVDPAPGLEAVHLHVQSRRSHGVC
jgi:hypothetical protein